MDDPVCRTTTSWFHLLTNCFHAEIFGEEEEHRQLPLDENVPQGCRSSHEGRCPRLKQYFRVVPRLAAEASYPGVWGSFDIIFRKTSDPHPIPWFGSVILHQAMGVGFYSCVQYTTLDMEPLFKTIILLFIPVIGSFRLIQT